MQQINKKCINCGVLLTKPHTMSWKKYEDKKRCVECNKIYLKRFLKNGKGDQSAKWKQGRTTYGGYAYVFMPDHPNANYGGNKYYSEHRFVMEQHIGRYLLKSELVHHINGDTLDNRIENLVLCAERKEHAKQHPEIQAKQKIDFKGKHFSPSTEFKKGMIPWNKRTQNDNARLA
jgi:hypothetical protein